MASKATGISILSLLVAPVAMGETASAYDLCLLETIKKKQWRRNDREHSQAV